MFRRAFQPTILARAADRSYHQVEIVIDFFAPSRDLRRSETVLGHRRFKT